MKAGSRKVIKTVGFSLLGVLGLIILILAGYLIWLTVADYQPEATLPLTVEQNPEAALPLGERLVLADYNIGFGAYDHDFAFFMDGGTQSVAVSRESVEWCVNGAITALVAESPDFAFIQEVDIGSTRSHNTDQYQMLQDGMKGYGFSYAVNYDVPWIAYPFTEMHGRVYAGLSTASRYRIDRADRISLPIVEDWPARLFGLDRCLLISRTEAGNGKELVLINLHLSAYDPGGVIREKQLTLLEELLEEEYQKGNYVIAGGDWNHVIPTTDIDRFQKEEPRAEWFIKIPESFAPEHFAFFADGETPSCRTAGIPYDRDYNFSAVIDGFLVSDNVTVEAVRGIDLDFLYSDHNPVVLEFSLQ